MIGKRLLILCGLAAALAAQQFTAAFNCADDIEGEPDARVSTWGKAGSAVHDLRFNPPVGHRVRILRVYGDFLIWPVGKVEPGRFAGALFGLQTTAPEGSQRCDPCADNTVLYLQSATGGEVNRAPFDHNVSAGGLLGPDHILRVKVAVWLNDTGLKIHLEPSFVMVYRWERID